MKDMRIVRRWAPAWLSASAGGLAVFLVYVAVAAIIDPDDWFDGIRIAVLPLLVLAYLCAAVAANQRTIIVSADGVSMQNGPVPIGSFRRLSREAIVLCYARYIYVEHGGKKIDAFHTAGVQSAGGYQLDVSERVKTADEALRTARAVAAILNRREPFVPVETTTGALPDPSWARQVLSWAAGFVGAVIIGTVWEFTGVDASVLEAGLETIGVEAAGTRR